ALQHERLAAGDGGQPALELITLAGEDQRREGGQLGGHGGEGRPIPPGPPGPAAGASGPPPAEAAVVGAVMRPGQNEGAGRFAALVGRSRSHATRLAGPASQPRTPPQPATRTPRALR